MSDDQVLGNRLYSYDMRSDLDIETVALEIQQISQEQNPKYEITGLICFTTKNDKIICFQYFEGPKQHVDQLAVNIANDERVASVKLLAECEQLSARLFPDFDMKLVSLGEWEIFLNKVQSRLQFNHDRDAHF